MFEWVGPEFGFGKRLVMANLWLFSGVLASKLEHKPATDALLRTTTAPTMLEGSPKSNVLPQRARAVVNFRIKPGDTADEVLAHLRRVIADPRVELQAMGHEPVAPRPASSSSSRVFRAMQRSIRRVDPSIVVAPGLMIAYTDSRHYADIADDIYRFTPVRVRAEDLRRIHGVDERVSVANYAEAVAFYDLLMRELSGSESP
jgi:carboxypeptidase PM20D1